MVLIIIFRRNKSNFRDDQTNLTTAQSSVNSNDNTHQSQNIRRYYFYSKTVNLIIFISGLKLNGSKQLKLKDM